MLDIVQSEIDGNTQMTLESTSVRDTYVATDSSVYDQNIDLTHDDAVTDWNFIQNVSNTDAFYQTEVFCQDTHCYTTCLIEREINGGGYDAAEDIYFAVSQEIQIKGQYYAKGELQDPDNGQTSTGCWSRGQSNDWVTITIPAEAIPTMAVSTLVLSYFVAL